MNLAAVMLLLPRMVQILMEGLIRFPKRRATSSTGAPPTAKSTSALDSAILIGHRRHLHRPAAGPDRHLHEPDPARQPGDPVC